MNKLLCLPIVVLVTAALPVRGASACDVVTAAVIKVFEVPTHMYMTESGGRTRSAETIYLNGVTYVKVGGPWKKSQIPPKTLAEAKKESEDKMGTCSVVRDEAVGGEPATLYKVHYRSEEAIDVLIWVSKLRGLPMKQSYDQNLGAGARGVSHTEIRYEYSNVSAPAVTESTRK